MFIARAASVLNVGHVPMKSAMPRIETIAEATASCLHAFPGTRMPQNDRVAATNPIRDRIQKMLATVVARGAASEGNSHDRAGNQEPVSIPRLCAKSAPSAPP